MNFLRDIPSFPSLFSPQRASSSKTPTSPTTDLNNSENEEDLEEDEKEAEKTLTTNTTTMPSPALRVTPTLSVPAAKARALHTYTSPATPGRTEASQPNIISRTPKLATGTSPASTVRASLRRNKVKLKPGFSALDWSKLRSSGKNLRGVEYPGLIRVTAAELAQHQTKDDAWTALGGKVYNMTHYMGFHPGGERDLMRVAGKDGTKLFMATHSWVSFESMLDGCLVGFYQP